jgi:hypothetical protein
MSNRSTLRSLLVLAGLLVVSLGCPRTPDRVYPPGISSSAGPDAVTMFDTNNDKKLEGAELDKCPGLKAALSKVDPANQGVTADMIAARIQAWKKSLVGRMSLSCRVTHNGQPLAGAEVTFVPEKFLGTKIQVATGKTDPNGMAMLSAPPEKPRDPPGVPPGFYRVEITAPGLNIPAKYNTETTLGQEVALDAKGIQEGISFDLKF